MPQMKALLFSLIVLATVGCQPIDLKTPPVNNGNDSSNTQLPAENINQPGSSAGVETDGDNDGVFDDSDSCPNTAPGKTVEANGCEIPNIQPVTDSDGDGVDDVSDNCPSTPLGKAVDANGCEMPTTTPPSLPPVLDTDNDGVTDNKDNCPNSVAGRPVDANGCEMPTTPPPVIDTDTDNDGVTDAQDSCPNTVAGRPVDASGCEIPNIQPVTDSDGDGVDDVTDTCPNTELGKPVDANGCEMPTTPPTTPPITPPPSLPPVTDTDNDGVADNQDTCPSTPAGKTVDANGCSWAQQDADNDGVLNGDDKCQQTAGGATVNHEGCAASQLDTDADGVTNDLDVCPNTPQGKTVDVNGCEIPVAPAGNDADGDGVDDAVDKCAFTPEEYVVDETGCKDVGPDADDDAIADTNDECPGTPEDELSDESGCSASQRDRDQDGYTDDVDLCLATPLGEQVDVHGCGQQTQQSTHKVVWSEDFESVDLVDLAERGKKAEFYYIDESEVIADCGPGRNQCVRLEYAPTDVGSKRVTRHINEFEGGTHYSLQYDIMFEDDFEFVRGGKLPGLASTTHTSGCSNPVAGNWSVRLMWRPEGSAQAYHYTQERVEACGDGGRTRPGVFKLGQWHSVRLEVKLNSAADSHDGHVRLFVDGVLEVQHEGMRYRSEINEDSKIKKLFFSTFYGGSDPTWAPSKTTYIRFDNFKITDHDS